MNALVTVVKMMKCDVFSLKIPISSVSNYRLLNELAGNLISIEYLDQRKMLRGTLNSYHKDVLSPVFQKSKNRNSNIYKVMIITYILTFIHTIYTLIHTIATTPRCREGGYSFPWIAPLYPRYVPYNAEC